MRRNYGFGLVREGLSISMILICRILNRWVLEPEYKLAIYCLIWAGSQPLFSSLSMSNCVKILMMDVDTDVGMI